MAGEGFARHGSTSLQENRRLLNRKKLFEKERSFLNLKNQVFHQNSNGILSKNLTKQERKRYRNKTIRSYAKDEFYTRMIAMFGAVLFLVIILSLYIRTGRHEITIKENKQKYEITEKRNSYNYYITSGNEWYDQKKFYNAAFQYRLALEVFPEDSLAREKLIQAYDSNCFYDNRNCGKSEALMNSLKMD